MPDEDVVTQALHEAILYARLAERLRACAAQADSLLQALNAVTDLDAELVPEVVATRDHVLQAGEGMLRALTFVDARFDARVERMKAS